MEKGWRRWQEVLRTDHPCLFREILGGIWWCLSTGEPGRVWSALGWPHRAWFSPKAALLQTVASWPSAPLVPPYSSRAGGGTWSCGHRKTQPRCHRHNTVAAWEGRY